MSRRAALMRERAAALRLLANVEEQLADLEDDAPPANVVPTEIERARARKAYDRALAKRGR
jgi:hypothetical protein